MFKSKYIIPYCICIFIIFLLMFSNANIESSKFGLKLWADSIVPSLLPFFIATELLGYSDFVYVFGKILNKLMKPIFNVPGISAYPLIMGIISGYPIGAKIVSNLKSQGKLTSIEAERLIAYTNNSGPLFIIGTVGIGLFKSKYVGFLLLMTHLIASITVGIIFKWWKYGKTRNEKKEDVLLFSQNKITINNLGEVLSNSIMNAINTILLIGGFIVLFSVIISILENSRVFNIFNNSSSFTNGIISGVIELTNGVSKIVSISTCNLSIIICAFLIGFGGISVCLQVLSVISKARISIKPYIIGKLLQGILAAVYTYIFIYFLQPLLNL